MRISINYRPVDGPWGGGNRFVSNLAEEARVAGHEVCFDLKHPMDVILMVDPRTRIDRVQYGPRQILRCRAFRPRTVVVHRVNDCDLRKGTEGIDRMLVRASRCADRVVFNGGWMMDLPAWRGLTATPDRRSVIHDGADPAVFRPLPTARRAIEDPLRLVTHHWGAHWRKGFDVYAHLDGLLDREDMRALFSLTYIGNLPADFTFRNVAVQAPLNGAALADALRAHDAYLTASLYEPSGNHHIEGAMCGLPLVYRNSGALPEYCQGFGLPFHGPDDVVAAIAGMKGDFPRHKARMPAYDKTKKKCCAAYLALFSDLVARRVDKVPAGRRVRQFVAGVGL